MNDGSNDDNPEGSLLGTVDILEILEVLGVDIKLAISDGEVAGTLLGVAYVFPGAIS